MALQISVRPFQRRTRFAQARGAFALLVLSESNQQGQMRPPAAFCWLPVRLESELSAGLPPNRDAAPSGAASALLIA